MKIGEYETHPAADLLPLIEGQAYADLCESVRQGGLKRPIVLFDNQVLDGRNRLRACLEVGATPEFVTWKPGGSEDNPFQYVWALNLERRHLEPGQRAALRLEFDQCISDYERTVRERANRARSTKAKKRSKKAASQSVATLPPTENETTKGQPAKTTKTREVLARAAGVSPKTAQKALTVKKKAPELHKAVIAGKVSLNAAYRETTKQDAVSKINTEPPPLPTGPFRVLVADPPWAYGKRAKDGSHRGVTPYPTMQTSEICALPVRELAHEDAILWLWTTNAHMRDAYQVIEAWGFEGKTILTWVKPRIGLGDWLRNQTEHCIVATRGKPTVTLKGQSTVLKAPRRQHSRKPVAFYELVEGLCPGSRVELFGREGRPGWTTWGAESDKFDKGAS